MSTVPIYKTVETIKLPEDMILIYMTEIELRRFMKPEWKKAILFEDPKGNLFSFEGGPSRRMIIVRAKDRKEVSK